MIKDRYNKTVKVSRLGGTEKHTYTRIFSCMGWLQPMSPTQRALTEGQYSQPHLLFTDLYDIRLGDKVTIENVDYMVREKSIYDMGENPHLELTVELTNADRYTSNNS